jgi:hypothetical protein
MLPIIAAFVMCVSMRPSSLNTPLQRVRLPSQVQTSSFTAPVGNLQVVVPELFVPAQLPATDDGVVTIGKHAAKPL